MNKIDERMTAVQALQESGQAVGDYGKQYAPSGGRPFQSASALLNPSPIGPGPGMPLIERVDTLDKQFDHFAQVAQAQIAELRDRLTRLEALVRG